jgi:hypothetical protein
MAPLTVTTTTTTPQRLKPPLERKEHILTPISNGPTPVRVRVFIESHVRERSKDDA